MKHHILFAILILCISYSQSQTSSCGLACANNNACSGSCSACVNGICSKGAPCNSFCNVNTDCDSTSPCTTCRNGKCTGDGTCLAYCNSTSDCYNGACTVCSSNKCVAGCNTYCNSSDVCNYPGSSCPQCIDQMCQKGGCGATCFVNSDCSGQGYCTNCYNFVCSSHCGGKCTIDSDCQGTATGCGACTNGTCTVGTCGTACSNNNGCGGATCSRCANFVCTNGLPCGSNCNVNSDCDLTTSCNQCIAGVCTNPYAFNDNVHKKK